ncbi:uncharacterized protein LOC121799926 isoform X2 [Salvia splendens]|uniref:uncharacterized protein LOC121799926 isoform X2 n=1 Tax=Salvia splendens TaxID=180675 RepID=UPI001C28098B|nr:uncharacterized protein LOC121799926 isoform X2 [Salvia splendens]
MPRPGPRPYECVRRAWHSERHQPMRGLVIQQIFRLVHDNHSAATKKNREWQEKLPLVVLKAEEIMYSKANSEAEYSNVETLWDRVNDVVDTIIRKDESTETGELLPPCVEAALNLGCVPVRASRSERHNNPRTYLRSSYRECNKNMSPRSLNDNVNERNPDLMHAAKMPQHVDSSRLVWESNNRITPNSTNQQQHMASSFEKKLHCVSSRNAMEVERSNAWLSRSSVYPLYYGMDFKPEVCQLGFQVAQKSDSVIIGVPVFSSPAESASEVGCLQNLFPYGEDKFFGKRTCEVASKDTKGKGPQAGFDLSLRLGLFSDSNSGREDSSGFVSDSLGRRLSPYEGLPVEEFPFFPMEPAHSQMWLHRSNQNEESENQNAELVSRKRKLSVSGDLGNDQFFWSQDSTNRFVGQMKRPVGVFYATLLCPSS